jgi:hypothetical protein
MPDKFQPAFSIPASGRIGQALVDFTALRKMTEPREFNADITAPFACISIGLQRS